MKRILFIATVASSVMLLSVPCYGATEITLDQVDQVEGLSFGDTVFAVDPVRFICRWTYTPGDGSNVSAFTNGFRVWAHQNGAYTNNFNPITFDTLPLNWKDMFDGGLFMTPYSADGMGADTMKFGGFRIGGPGLHDGFDEQVWWVGTANLVAGDTVCIDSSFAFPGNVWCWSTTNGTLIPDWSGPHCFHVAECCIINWGNVDMDGSVGIADLTFLINYLFLNGPAPPCTGAGDVDGDGAINIADLTYLVDFLFRGGPPPPPCP